MAAFLAQQQGQGMPPAHQYPGGVSMAAAPPQAQQPQYATPPPAAAAGTAAAGAFPSTVEQRVTMEVNSLKAMLSAIVDALQVFTSTQAPHAAQPVSMAEVCKMFNLIVDVLQQDPNIGRVRYLLFDSIPEGYPTVFSVLFSCLNANLSFAPGVHSTEETKTQIGRLRTTTLRTLSKVISMSSYDHFPSVAETAAVSQLCTKAVTQHRGVEMLLSIICGGPHISEEAKIAAVECILVLVVRNDSGKQAIVETPGGLQHLGTALQAERSPMVRNYTATCVRELANTHPSYIVQSGFPELVVGIVRGDSSADVRECALRTLDIVFKSDSSYAGRYPLKPELAEVLQGLLEGDNNRDVTENACRLLSTLFCLEGRNATRTEHDAVFTAAWVEREAYRTLLKVAAGRSGSQVAGFAARAFRHLVQHCPWQLQFGHRLIENWESVDCLLLKALQPTSAPKPDDKETQIPLVELSISTALLFAQSPYTRSAIHRELSGFPAYLPALRSHIIGSLEIPTLEYYAGIDLFDVTGTHVNEMQGIQWNVNDKGTHVPTPSSVRQVFVQQDQRVAEQARSGAAGAAGGARGGAFPAASTSYDEPDVQRQKEMRLTFILCTYAVHLALSPGPAAAAAAPAGAAAALASSASSSSSASDTRDASSSPRDAAAAAAAAAAAGGGGYPMRYPSHHSTVHGDGAAAPAHHQEQHPAYFPGDSAHHQQQQPQNPPSYPGMGASVGAPPPQMWQGGPPPPGEVGGGSPVGPAPTRASIMREHNAHPDRAQAALLRQMRQQQQQQQPPQPQPHPADPQYPNETMQSYNMPSQIDPRGSQIMHGHPNHTASLSYSIGPPGGYAFQPEQASAARSLGGRGGPPGPPAFQHEPMFPTAGRPSPSAAAPRARVNPELRQTYSKFDQALKLTIHFAQYFNRKVETKPTYKATPDGYVFPPHPHPHSKKKFKKNSFMVRQTHIANPWTPVVKKAKLKTWTVKDLKVRVGPLCFLSTHTHRRATSSTSPSPSTKSARTSSKACLPRHASTRRTRRSSSSSPRSVPRAAAGSCSTS